MLDKKFKPTLIPDQIQQLLRVMLKPRFSAYNNKMHIDKILRNETWMSYLKNNILKRIGKGDDVGYFQDAEYFQNELLDRLPKEKALEVCKQLIEPSTEPAGVAEKIQKIFSVANNFVVANSKLKVNNFFKDASLVLNQGVRFYER